MRTELCHPKTILFPVDLSEQSASTAVLVGTLVRCFQSRAVVLFALEPVDHPFELLGESMHETRSRAAVAKARLAEFIEHLGVDFAHELRVEEGKPASVIVHVAEEINADLICMPTRGHGPLRTFLLGSTTAKVLNDAHVPVLTNSHLKDSKDVNAPGLRNIVCGLSLDDQGKRALDAAMLLAKTFNANLTVVHALESDNPSVSDRVFEAVRSAAEQPPILPGIVISNGNIPQIVETIAKDRHADLVVIGRSAPSPLGRLRANSYAIIRSAPCPVLSV